MNASDFVWYHRINLGDEQTEPPMPFDETWNMVRKVRNGIDYGGKRVLDIATFDGMWAFEAEALGSAEVVAIDIPSMLNPEPLVAQAPAKFLYAHRKLKSGVIPYFGQSVHQLESMLPVIGAFDIIQNLGLLYHQLDLVQALRQCRKMIRDGGTMLLESAYDPDLTGATMRFNRGPNMFYPTDMSSYWAPSLECLHLMCEASGWSVKDSQSVRQHFIGRVAMICVPCAVPPDFNDDYRL